MSERIVPRYYGKHDMSVDLTSPHTGLMDSELANEPKVKEAVNHPDHYLPGTYETINIIEAYNLGFHRGNALKYILRAGRKTLGKKEDLQKAIWYLQRELENL